MGYLKDHLSIGKSPESLKTGFGQFQRFIHWCDEHCFFGLDSEQDFVTAVSRFTDFLIDQIRKSDFNINTAATLQLVVMTVGRHIYDDPYGELFRGIRRISRSANAVKSTEKPDEEAVRSALRLYSDLLNQLSDFVLLNEDFPKKIQLEDKPFWFFPTLIPFSGPKSSSLARTVAAYDYIHGRVRTIDEIEARIKPNRNSPYNARNARSRAISNLFVANNYRYHTYRIKAAMFAYQAFTMLFSANTGMNLGTMRTLEWTGDYETSSVRQGFKTIKYRAGNRLVEFILENTFIAVFNKGLKLREYILKALKIKEFEWFFFTLKGKALGQLPMNFSNDFHNRLEKNFDYKNKITTRMWRAYKSDYLIRNSDVGMASLLLQNTTDTVLKHYAEGSQSEAYSELNNFFSAYKNEVLITATETSSDISLGQCISPDSPKSMTRSGIEPSCRVPEGCLFCDKYRIHADKIDLKKLLSCKYVLQQSVHLASSENHYKDVVVPVLERIDELVSAIKDAKLLAQNEVSRIEMDVLDHEILDSYWSMKLQLLEDLGVV